MNWPKYAEYADYADHADYSEYAEYAEYAGHAEFVEYAKGKPKMIRVTVLEKSEWKWKRKKCKSDIPVYIVWCIRKWEFTFR